jgi:hypothetical protein
LQVLNTSSSFEKDEAHTAVAGKQADMGWQESHKAAATGGFPQQWLQPLPVFMPHSPLPLEFAARAINSITYTKLMLAS